MHARARARAARGRGTSPHSVGRRSWRPSRPISGVAHCRPIGLLPRGGGGLRPAVLAALRAAEARQGHARTRERVLRVAEGPDGGARGRAELRHETLSRAGGAGAGSEQQDNGCERDQQGETKRARRSHLEAAFHRRGSGNSTTSPSGTLCNVIMRACSGAERPDPALITEALRKPLLDVFPAALLGRMVVIPYYPLNDEMIGNIVRLQLDRIERRVTERYAVPFTYAPSVVELITSRCNELESGRARWCRA